MKLVKLGRPYFAVVDTNGSIYLKTLSETREEVPREGFHGLDVKQIVALEIREPGDEPDIEGRTIRWGRGSDYATASHSSFDEVEGNSPFKPEPDYDGDDYSF